MSVAIGLYVVRMLDHRLPPILLAPDLQDLTSLQFVMAWIGASSAQRGPIWWAVIIGITILNPIPKKTSIRPVTRGS